MSDWDSPGGHHEVAPARRCNSQGAEISVKCTQQFKCKYYEIHHCL